MRAYNLSTFAEKVFKDIYALAEPTHLQNDVYLLWTSFACKYVYKYVCTYSHVYTYAYVEIYECAERDFRHTFMAIKIMIIEKLKRIGCKTQTVILLSYFSSGSTNFVYVVSKWHHLAWPKMSPDPSSSPS